MKKLFATILLCLFIPNIALATVQVYDRYIMFSYGLSELDVSKKRVGEGITEAIVLTGNDLSKVEITNETNFSKEQNEILLFPGRAGMNSYDFWKVSGTYDGKNFFIFGYTIETGGDTWLERNSVTIDVIKTFVFIGLIAMIGFLVWKRKQKTSANNE